MLFRIFLSLVIFLYCPLAGSAGTYVYDYNSNCSKAYQDYLSLHMKDARAAVITEMKANPYNLMSTYLSDYEDCLILLLNCDKDDYAQRISHFDSRLELLEKGDESSPWYRFCKAGIYMHWAIVNTRFGEEYSAAIKFRKSFALLKENQRLFPGFEYNQVFSGLQEAVVGSLPGNYKWLAAIFGLKGNTKMGIGKLSAFLNTHTSGQLLYAETILYYTYTRFYMLSEQKEAWAFLNGPKFQTGNNLLNTFVKANIALDYRQSDVALETLRSAATDPDYNKYPVFDLQMGHALAAKSDIACTDYFQRYLKNNKSDIYIKECSQRMAYAWYINGDMQRAEFCRQQIKLRGTIRLDADKQAEKFANSKIWPNKQLLEARLLIDGGYPAQAFAILSSMSVSGLANPADKAEYYFRFGRIYEETGDNKNALEYYQNAINTGKERHEQFAARAALQMGVIYEHSGNPAYAVIRYKQSLAMPSHDFQNSIDQLAKAGINRIEGN